MNYRLFKEDFNIYTLLPITHSIKLICVTHIFLDTRGAPELQQFTGESYTQTCTISSNFPRPWNASCFVLLPWFTTARWGNGTSSPCGDFVDILVYARHWQRVFPWVVVQRSGVDNLIRESRALKFVLRCFRSLPRRKKKMGILTCLRSDRNFSKELYRDRDRNALVSGLEYPYEYLRKKRAKFWTVIYWK